MDGAAVNYAYVVRFLRYHANRPMRDVGLFGRNQGQATLAAAFDYCTCYGNPILAFVPP
jgi:hypothetical protein